VKKFFEKLKGNFVSDIFFSSFSKKELIDTISYFEGCRKGLGFEFAKEIFSTIQRIIYFPAAWSGFSKKTRRCLVNRFPFGIIYQFVDNKLIIVAVMQVNRKPGYWKKRL
jgi:hypothetical protein